MFHKNDLKGPFLQRSPLPTVCASSNTSGFGRPCSRLETYILFLNGLFLPRAGITYTKMSIVIASCG